MGEETSNGLVVVILALAAVLFLAMLLAGGEAMAAHNQAMAGLVFSEERLPLELTEEEREAVLWMREQIAALKTLHEAQAYWNTMNCSFGAVPDGHMLRWNPVRERRSQSCSGR